MPTVMAVKVLLFQSLLEDTWIETESLAWEVSCLIRVPLPWRLFESID